MSTNNYNNLTGVIKQVKPIEMFQNRIKIFQDDPSKISFGKDEIQGEILDRTKDKIRVDIKKKSKYIRMDNFMKPVLSNLSTVEDIKKKIKTGKITFDNTFDKEDDPKFMKVVTIAPGFVYGVDTREYNPKKNIPTGPSISDIAN